MNKQEARRYAHKLAADAITEHITAMPGSPDAPKILRALSEIVESHIRFGPRTSDRKPREAPQKIYTGEALPFADIR
jgi:hypothetical protein